jgi:hypothetical protein
LNDLSFYKEHDAHIFIVYYIFFGISSTLVFHWKFDWWIMLINCIIVLFIEIGFLNFFTDFVGFSLSWEGRFNFSSTYKLDSRLLVCKLLRGGVIYIGYKFKGLQGKIQAQVVQYICVHGTVVISDDHKGDASFHKSNIISIFCNTKKLSKFVKVFSMY